MPKKKKKKFNPRNILKYIVGGLFFLAILLCITLDTSGSADFKTQIVKITIPASTDQATATAPADFDSVDTSRTIALISGMTDHAMGWTQQTTQDPVEISARVELVNGSTIQATRSSSSIAQTDTVWVLLIEYIGTPGGSNELIVRDRRVNSWTGGTTTDSYGPIASVVDTNDVVIFNAGTENPNTASSDYDRGDIRAYIDGTKNVQLIRGDGAGVIESSHQVVEFTGSNWTIQSGDAIPAQDPGGTNVAISDVGNINNAWVYFNVSSNSGNLDERGHRSWLTTTTNLRVQEHGAATGTKTVRWYVISNPQINVQTGSADNQFTNDLTNSITGFTPVTDTSRSFAWVHGMTNGGGNAHPRDTWQFELADASTIDLERGYNGQNLDYRYYVVELPLGPSSLPTQIHYHWRNDDGSETTATSATSSSEDTAQTDLPKNTKTRLRMQVSNEGSLVSSNINYRLEYGIRVTDCASIIAWTDVGAAGGDWDMGNSTNLNDGDNTTNISVVTGGTTDENSTFLTPNGAVKDTSSVTSAISLANDEFVEIEYSIQALDAASDGSAYCFRLTDTGTPLPVYSVYPEIILQNFNEFKTQRGAVQVSGTGATITAGVDYEAPAALNRAFIRITNTQMTGAGNNTGGGNQNADDVTVYISNPENLLTSITFSRPATATSNTRVDWEIIEYVGDNGRPNEIIVRDQGTTTYSTVGITANSGVINGVINASNTVPFITSQLSPDTSSNDYNTVLSTADWNPSTSQIDFTRGEASGDAVRVSWALVEFVGENWQIQRSEHSYTAAGAIENESITQINDITSAFLHVQKRVGSGLQGLDEFGHEIWLSADNAVSFRLQAGSGTPANHTSVAWVIENTQTNGTPMEVTRSTGSSSGGAEPLTVSVNIGKTLNDITNASIFTNCRVTGTGTAFPRPIIGVQISSDIQYTLWISDTGQTNTFRTEVVEWPISPAPPVPVDVGESRGRGSLNIAPENYSIIINNGESCTESRGVILNLEVDNAIEIMVANDIDFTGQRWMPYISSQKIWGLNPGDGVKSVYVKFQSHEGIVSDVISDSIELATQGCIPEEEEEEEEEEEIAVDACLIDCEKVDYEIYIVNPDNSKRFMSGAHARIEEINNTTSKINFDDSGKDLDFDDLVLQIERSVCELINVKPISIDANWSHNIRAVLLYEDYGKEDILLWKDSHKAIGEEKVINVYDYPDICMEADADFDATDGITVFEHINYAGQSEVFYVGETDFDLRNNLINQDTISSIEIFGQATVQLFEHVMYGGAESTITQSDPDLRDGPIGNDLISSLRIFWDNDWIK